MIKDSPRSYTIDGESNRTFPAQKLVGKMLTLRDCKGVVIDGWSITGGITNVEFENCVDCTIQNSTLRKPSGPPDPYGNHILFNGCKGCKAINNTIERWYRSEMGIGFFDSSNCEATDNTIQGLIGKNGKVIDNIKSQSGDGITADFKSFNCRLINNKFDLTGANGKPSGYAAINLSYGSGHLVDQTAGWVKGSTAVTPYNVNPCYDSKGNPADADTQQIVPVTNCEFKGIPTKLVFVHYKCKNIKVNGVTFPRKELEKGADVKWCKFKIWRLAFAPGHYGHVVEGNNRWIRLFGGIFLRYDDTESGTKD